MPRLRKEDVYKWIKIGGLLSFLPFVLAAGPLAGYFFGNYLEKKIGAPYYITVILVAIGFAGSVREAVRIVMAALRSEKKDK